MSTKRKYTKKSKVKEEIAEQGIERVTENDVTEEIDEVLEKEQEDIIVPIVINSENDWVRVVPKKTGRPFVSTQYWYFEEGKPAKIPRSVAEYLIAIRYVKMLPT